MNLRAGSAADAAAMASVHAQAFDAPWDQAAFEQLLSGPGVYAFLVAGDDPMGFVLCRAAAGEAEVLTVGVAPWARRRGIGAALMTAAVAAARTAGAQAMFLEVDADNAAALALYESLGFERAGLRKAYYDRGLAGRADAVVMRLDLASNAH
ncbi:MAG: ribosomal-protein-alanine N-acetyltransferase [Phenylobacterium sp.]|uniref:ribosomal protein S18-alanine N-acetyltransferase n=1 Tax=Phenylobacterium sp. TaxID=1871053 RepID=UPI0025F1C587|nr:ribosomal protein S18-alanine N-acetyltransferase [Phenylobacterium sp.]MBI1200758.1 ribosomal-protein-alanine N-acetyltransferase [Phenylobacterium sp.]